MERQRILQNNRLIWVDANINEKHSDTQQTLERFRTIIHYVDLFKEVRDCIGFLNKIKHEKVSIITSESFGQTLIRYEIQNLSQVDAIYILSGSHEQDQSWSKRGDKVKRIYNDIKTVCEVLRETITQTNEDLTPFSFISHEDIGEGSNINLNRLESSFIYTTLFKCILLKTEHGSDDKQAFVQLCRTHYSNNPKESEIVEEFNRDYRPEKAVWWYTRGCFIYQILNRAFRLLELDMMIDMGFFIYDLHHELERLHLEQFSDYNGPSLTFYRSQTISIEDFAKLRQRQGNFIAFPSFLSASTTKSFSLDELQQNSLNNKIVAILFVITVDTMMSPVIFAIIEQQNYLENENKVLFSMNAVFRIEKILESDEIRRFSEVHLTLTSDDGCALSRLSDRIEEEIGNTHQWDQLGHILFKKGQQRATKGLDRSLSMMEPMEQNQGFDYIRFVQLKNEGGDYEKPTGEHQRPVSIYQGTLPRNRLLSSMLNSNICPIYWKKQENPESLSYNNISSRDSDKADNHRAMIRCMSDLSNLKKTLPANHLSIATSYENIGLIFVNMGKYCDALSYYEKALAILEEIFPDNHPTLVTFYNNISSLYLNVEQYSEALFYYKKALANREKTLNDDLTDLATSYNNSDMLHSNAGDYSRALICYMKDLAIKKKTLPDNHSSLATSYENIGLVLSNMGGNLQGLSYYEKALAILENTFPANCADLVISYNNISSLYLNIHQYSEALFYYKKALAILEKTLPVDRPYLASSYNNTGLMCLTVGANSQSLSYFSRALDIQKKIIPEIPCNVVYWYNNLGIIYDNMEEYHRALRYFIRVLVTRKRNGPMNCWDLMESYNNIGTVCFRSEQYSQALWYYLKTLSIQEKILPENHNDIVQSYNCISALYYKLKNYSEGLSYAKKVLAIREKILPDIHPDKLHSWYNIGLLYYSQDKYSETIEFCSKILGVRRELFLDNRPGLATSYTDMASSYLKSRDYFQTLTFVYRALAIEEKTWSPVHSSLISIREDPIRVLNEISKKSTTSLCETRSSSTKIYVNLQPVGAISPNVESDISHSDVRQEHRTSHLRDKIKIIFHDLRVPDSTPFNSIPCKSCDDDFECLSYISSAKDEHIFLVTTSSVLEYLMPLIHAYPQLEAILSRKDSDDDDEVSTLLKSTYFKVSSFWKNMDDLCTAMNVYIDGTRKNSVRWNRSVTLFNELYAQTLGNETITDVIMRIDAPCDIRIIIFHCGLDPLFHAKSDLYPIQEFNRIGDCIAAIENQTDKLIFFIIAGQMASSRLETCLNSSKICSLYYFQTTEEKYPIDHRRISGFFHNLNELQIQLQKDIWCFEQYPFHVLPIHVLKKFNPDEKVLLHELCDTSVDFLMWQLFIDILTQIPDLIITPDELSTACIILGIDINKTHPTFDSLVSCNVENISNEYPLFHPFVTQCYRQVALDNLLIMQRQLSSMINKISNSEPLQLGVLFYRIQLVNQRQLQKLRNNRGEIIMISFLPLATRSLLTARSIARNLADTGFVPVLFQLEMTVDSKATPIDSDRVMLQMGASFQLNSIDQAADGVWYAKLEHTQSRYSLFRDILEDQLQMSLSWLTLGNYLGALNRLSQAENYHAYLMEKLPRDHQKRAALYNNIGLMYTKLRRKDEAMKYYQFALDHIRSNEVGASEAVQYQISELGDQDDSDDNNSSIQIDRSKIYKSMGKIYEEKGYITSAVESYQNALNMTWQKSRRRQYQQHISSISKYLDQR